MDELGCLHVRFLDSWEHIAMIKLCLREFCKTIIDPAYTWYVISGWDLSMFGIPSFLVLHRFSIVRPN